ncbi:transcriptional regulator/sugar kinase [Solibacillus silvestris StLB046]|uniref:Transcriptional regulator/sugar kinase n=1 Tax=Solibacillus silvestris (strain StLB046) TaxID=1002809 RepID=F2F2I0_SOLSS|nr:transcriptional regulator [Solibacillus silvestris]BAK15818.1 transcriptional regulator/sugar kinase [Solibacillus silvestris StLB046]
MNSCNECGRHQCDCEVMMLDQYGTEIVPGEEYILNNFDEVIHKDNVIRYLIEDGSHQLKTR